MTPHTPPPPVITALDFCIQTHMQSNLLNNSHNHLHANNWKKGSEARGVTRNLLIHGSESPVSRSSGKQSRTKRQTTSHSNPTENTIKQAQQTSETYNTGALQKSSIYDQRRETCLLCSETHSSLVFTDTKHKLIWSDTIRPAQDCDYSSATENQAVDLLLHQRFLIALTWTLFIHNNSSVF